jgi:hypothetical protein
MKKISSLLIALVSIGITTPIFTGITFMFFGIIDKIFHLPTDFNWSAMFVLCVIIGFIVSIFSAVKIYRRLTIKSIQT